MLDDRNMILRKSTAYAFAWLLYILFTLLSFPIFSITVMLFSIALSIIGAWLYRYPGWLLTTLLTIPYHYIMLAYSSNDPVVWNEAFNPFGITTQLFISGMIALLKSAKEKLDRLNTLLEQKVAVRTQELNRLRCHIVKNHEAVQSLLSQTLLNDLGDSLSDMQKKSDFLANRLIAEGRSESAQATRLNGLINKSIDLIQNLKFIDYFIPNDQIEFSSSLRKLTDNFREIAEIDFELDFDDESEAIPRSLQYPLYRITHEAVANATRHGKASLVKISLKLTESFYYLTVINNGQPMPTQPEFGLGIKLMQHHAHQVGGSIGFDTTPDGHTRLRCTIPQTID